MAVFSALLQARGICFYKGSFKILSFSLFWQISQRYFQVTAPETLKALCSSRLSAWFFLILMFAFPKFKNKNVSLGYCKFIVFK